MCGIVGYITTEDYRGSRDRGMFMEQALIIDTLRGEDSTGVFYGHTLKADKCAGYFKDAVDGYSYTQSTGFNKIMSKVGSIKYMVGHNRAATVGNVTVQTAHPFLDGPVIGVHNGTVRGGMLDLPMSMAEADVDVDSHCIIRNLAHVDPTEALTHVISKIDGAYMLVWRDDRDGSLNFARNSSRSFHFMQSYAEDTLFFASERGQLAWLNERLSLGGADVYSLNPGHRLKFTEGSLEPQVDKFTIAEPKPARTWNTWQAGAGASSVGKPKPAAKPAVPRPADNRVLLGGRKRDVPDLMQAQLMALPVPLAVEDRLTFTPLTKQPDNQLRSPASRRWVTGMLDNVSIPAIVYGVEKLVCENAWDRRWTVRPIGVRYTSPDEPAVVCSIVTSTAEGPDKLTLLDSLISSTKVYQTDVPNGLPGPEGSSISTADWLVLTKGGCVSCSRALMIADAQRLRWDLQTDEPQCPECAAMDDAAIEAMELGGYHTYIH